MNTKAVVSFANVIHNVPSTLAAIRSQKLDSDRKFQTLVNIAQHPDSNTTPASVDGINYQRALTKVGLEYQSGKLRDLKAGLRKADQQIDRGIARAR